LPCCGAQCRIIWNIITSNKTTKVRTICCCSRSLLGLGEASAIVAIRCRERLGGLLKYYSRAA
jgi:hypothetical protein